MKYGEDTNWKKRLVIIAVILVVLRLIAYGLGKVMTYFFGNLVPFHVYLVKYITVKSIFPLPLFTSYVVGLTNLHNDSSPLLEIPNWNEPSLRQIKGGLVCHLGLWQPFHPSA